MVERKLSEIYPGCAHNFAWLAKQMFLNPDNGPSNSPAENVLDWLLIGLRSLAVPELVPEKNKLEQSINAAYPKLLDELEPLVQSVPHICQDTTTCISMAKELVKRIKKYVDNHPKEEGHAKNKAQDAQKEDKPDENKAKRGEQDEAKPKNGNQVEDSKVASDSQDFATGPNETASAENSSQKSEEGCKSQTLEDLLGEATILPQKDMGEMAGKLLEAMGQTCSSSTLEVAIPRLTDNPPIKAEDITAIRQKTAALRTRLTALLQSKILCRSFPGRTGKIDTRRISRLAVSDSRIFARRNEKQGINTAVHILLDASGSMQTNDKIRLACHACYAVAEVLHKIPGVSVAVTSFPNGSNFDAKTGTASWATVCPVLGHKQKIHNHFEVRPNGGTPMASALWWVLQQMQPLTEKRKIVMLLSDGEPDNLEDTLNGIEAHKSCGHEVYGIGIISHAIRQIVGASRVIYDLQELAGAMFEMLQPALLGKIGGRYENAS